MGISLSEKSISSFESCLYQESLAYVKYPPKGSRCFSYPQFLVEENQLTLLEPSAFPDNGCLPMTVTDSSVSDMSHQFGDVVIMTVNDASPQDNRNYPEFESARYNSRINPSFPKGKSSVEFMSLARHPLSSSLLQVVEIQEKVDLTKPFDQAVHTFSNQASPQTKLVLIAQTFRGKKKYFGPFEYACGFENEIKLQASREHGMYIAELAEEDFDFSIDLMGESSDLVAQFVGAETFQDKFESCDQKFDWINDTELFDALGRISRFGEQPFSKSQMRALKLEISKCNEQMAKIALTPQRRERMVSLLDAYEDWTAIPDDIKSGIIERADAEQLAEYVLSNEHFREFYDKVIENEQIRDRVEQEKARCQSQVKEARCAAERAKAELQSIQQELTSYAEELEGKKAELELQVAKETEAFRQIQDDLAKEVESLTAEKERLKEDNSIIVQEIDNAIRGMSDKAAVSGKILESELLKQVITSLYSESSEARGGLESAKDLSTRVIRPDETQLTQDEVLDMLEHFMCECAGRDLSRNEVANLMICLTQGYILTLAGLPGTGKTSLAAILAGALGLVNSDSRRFLEVSVERGWTSYKDFIGYYNPLTKTMEKSNALAFDAFSTLDNEAAQEVEGQDVSPFFFLLDEANLSSVEHYWSPFLRACDSFNAGHFDLPLGGDCSFKVPRHTRFIATVNFDHTTEELSPRFLDRSWVIRLDPDSLDIEEDEFLNRAYDFSGLPAFSYSKMQEVFGVRDELMSVEFRSKLKEVMDICAKHHHPVSPRSQKMIQNYIRTAACLMDCATTQSAYAPVDYAVTQKVLPLLSGTEERLEDLLLELEKVSGLPIMRARVQHMLEVGNDGGFYQFFA